MSEEPRIGEVVILGNTITQDHVIRDVLNLYPGEKLQLSKLRVAEQNLAKRGLFRVDPKIGIRPTVTWLESPGQFKDIVVKVEEGQTISFKRVQVLTPEVGVGVAFVVEERNFDPRRIPNTMYDFAEGKAFRGGGQKLQVGIAFGSLSPPRLFVSVIGKEDVALFQSILLLKRGASFLFKVP
jgi:outer membrane protein assembly factor BamA